MLMKVGEHWRCTNSACRCEVLVETGGNIHGSNPVCACGTVMKKKYASPGLAYLEFLRDTESPRTQVLPAAREG